jgi:molybdopterin converting factor small subunit
MLMRFFFPYFKRAVLAVFKSEGTSFDKIKAELAELNKRIDLEFNANNVINANFDRLLYQKKILNRHSDNIAIFGVLPPEKSGIAIYNAKVFGISDDFHVFSKFMSSDNYETAKESIKEAYSDNFFPINLYSTAKIMFNYSKNIFVLGNSFHNIPYLDTAIKEQDKKNSYLYCHEVFFHDLLLSYLGFQIYKKVLCNAYPELAQEINNYNVETVEKIKGLCYGIRAIILLTEISNIIVNNSIAKEKLFEEIKGTIYENSIDIITLFHPISDLKINVYGEPKLSDTNEIKIGTFGICNNKYKSTDIIIDAVIYLNTKYKIKAKCILAGYEIDYYIKNFVSESQLNYVLGFSDISDEQIVSLMSQVDIAIQMRNYPHGETSGVICQLLGLNKNIIVSEKFIDSNLEKYCTIVKRFVSAEELAETIYKIINKKKEIIDSSRLIEEMSFEKLADAIRKL